MRKFKSKSGFSRTVQAFQWPQETPDGFAVDLIMNDAICPRCELNLCVHGSFDRKEKDPETGQFDVSPLVICPGDYMVKQADTEWYPVKPYVFKMYFKEIK